MKIAYKTKGSCWILVVSILFVAGVHFHPEITLFNAVMLMGLCFACELIDSGFGMGYGTILIPTLLLLGYSPADIVPTVLLSELLSGFSAAFFHHEIENVDLRPGGKDFKPAIVLAGGSMIGVTIGVLFAVTLSKEALSVTIGCIILLSGFFVILLSRTVIIYRLWKMVLLSGIASFNKAVSGGGYGPLVTSGQILSGVESKSSVGITSFAEAFTCLLAVTLFILKDGYINCAILIPMLAGALTSVPFAVFAINKSKEDHLKTIIGLLTMIMGALTIYKSFST